MSFVYFGRTGQLYGLSDGVRYAFAAATAGWSVGKYLAVVGDDEDLAKFCRINCIAMCVGLYGAHATNNEQGFYLQASLMAGFAFFGFKP